ncbi:hypothetical protein HYH03_000914 [Edaphochlamys debaryana]|uniref:Uncharacterized protein n=1 Tax=Edaphochlamys debaryana TaxID=47281 RepID=A0A835YHK3_9CHLO|nr:hypothetical protein HYH03_000914 [Edaphochlamys debaryana]|eukprot:KAG2501096.1 hypothetical protein HYH03_000914 [Edaphochlamys debaryana]
MLTGQGPGLSSQLASSAFEPSGRECLSASDSASAAHGAGVLWTSSSIQLSGYRSNAEFLDGIDAVCTPARSSFSLGEPGTPGGAGDSLITASPVTPGIALLRNGPRSGFGLIAAQLDSLAEDCATETYDLPPPRRSCSNNLDDLGLDDPDPFFSPASVRTGRGSGGGGLSSTSLPAPAASYQPTTHVNPALHGTPGFVNTLLSQLSSSDRRVRALEQQLREQKCVNEGLVRQLQQKDEHLSRMRSELDQLRAVQSQAGLAQSLPDLASPIHAHAMTRHHHAISSCGTPNMPYALGGQLHRALVHLTSSSSAAVEPPPPSTPPEDQADTAAEDPACAAVELAPPACGFNDDADASDANARISLLRLNTPPHEHTGDALTRSSCCRPGAVVIPDLADAAELELPTLESPQPQALPVQPGAEGTPAGATATVAAPAEAVAVEQAPAPHGQPQPLLLAEKQRTDRAHAALLVVSRTAARLSAELSEARTRVEALSSECRDWRDACLVNHRSLASIRRAQGYRGPVLAAQAE